VTGFVCAPTFPQSFFSLYSVRFNTLSLRLHTFFSNKCF
jgi:hypothetical protein